MNEIPLSLYIVICIIALIFMVASFIIDDNILAILFSFLSMALSFICAMMILNGSIVSIEVVGGAVQYIPITNTAISYFWDFIAALMGTCMVLYLVTEINIRLSAGDDYEYE